MKVVIIGAGIAGLSAGWFYKKLGHEVVIVEKSDRVGGWIRTTEVDGFLFEQGPRGFRPKERTLALVKELGLEAELVAASKAEKRRYVASHGKLVAVTPGFLLKNGMLRALWNDFRAGPSHAQDESIAQFCRRRFNQRLTDVLVDPLVKGVFGGDAEELSVRSCFPGMWMQEKVGPVFQMKRKKRKGPSLYTFKGGMETLTKRLYEKLEKEIRLETSEVPEGDRVIRACPARCFTSEHPFTYNSLTAVSLGWKEELLPKRGYGFLVPSMERENFLGMTWDSSIFPELNRGAQTRVCVMIGGNPENALDIAMSAAARYVRVSRPADAQLIGRAVEAIPQFTVGHHARLKRFKETWGEHLIGNNYSGAGVNDCIEGAWQSASP